MNQIGDKTYDNVAYQVFDTIVDDVWPVIGVVLEYSIQGGFWHLRSIEGTSYMN